MFAAACLMMVLIHMGMHPRPEFLEFLVRYNSTAEGAPPRVRQELKNSHATNWHGWG